MPLRVLIVAPREPWPLNGGGRLQLHHLLSQLARRACVTLALPEAPAHRERLPANVEVETIGDLSQVSRAEPPARRASLIGRLARRHFGTRVRISRWLWHNAHAARFDVVLLVGATMGQYAADCRAPVVWNPLDELVLPTIRAAELGAWHAWPGALRRAALYAAYQRDVARGVAATVFVSSVDAAYARRWTGDARIEVVPNGVDFDYFRPSAAPPAPGTIAFVGALEFPPNVDGITHFATHIWPRIHARGRGRHLLVVGRRPVAAVQALSQLPGVSVVGDVPDVRPYLTRAAVVVVPIRTGAGLKNKILEGCAMRRPVVASLRSLGGLTARPHIDLLAADRPQNWVASVCRLLERPAYAAEIAGNGHRWVRRAHSWTLCGTRFHEILTSVCGRDATRAEIAVGARPERIDTASRRPAARPQDESDGDPRAVGLGERELACR